MGSDFSREGYLVNGPDGAEGGGPLHSLVCFSHLRWGFVWQRPQHLLSRFAHDLRVYVVEEPEWVPGDAADLRIDARGTVTVLTPLLPKTPGRPWGFNARSNPEIRRLVTGYLRERELPAGGSSGVALWYSTPMALGAEPERLEGALVVYDVMDELSNFRGAPAELREREAALMERADLVFTGGPSLYRARQGRHPAVACFPSGVDVEHFAGGRGAAIPADLADAARPIIGFYGVIDERIDLDLIAGVADLRPEWTLAMVGPLAKIDEADLPRRPNLRYLGKKEYRELPAYLAAFDAAMLPFARNEATRFISPTKTPEYLAGGKPVVSTPITDVVDLYGRVVELGETPEAFAAAIERLWREPAARRAEREAVAHRILAAHDWDAIARRMRLLIDGALARRAAFGWAGSLAPIMALPADPRGEAVAD